MIDQIGPKRPGRWVEITLGSTDILVVCLEEKVETFLSKCRLSPDDFVKLCPVWYWNQERSKLVPQEGGLEGYGHVRWCRRGAIVSVVPFDAQALPILNISREREEDPAPPAQTPYDEEEDEEGDPESRERR